MRMKTSTGGIQVIARAAAVLRCLEDEVQGLSLGEIARRVGLPRSTIQRIVAALAAEELLTAATSTARVRLGPGLMHLAAAAQFGLDKIALPLMQQLSRLTDETVDLSMRRGESAVFIEQVQGTQRLAAISAVGKEFPLHCTANGKALLALLPPEQRDQLLVGRLKAYTAKTLPRDRLRTELRETESSGIAYDHEEHSVGITAIGTAFRDRLGRAYALSIPVPTARFGAKRKQLERLLAKTRKTLLERLETECDA